MTPQLRARARALFARFGITEHVDDTAITRAVEKLLIEADRHAGDPTSNLLVPLRAAFGEHPTKNH